MQSEVLEQLIQQQRKSEKRRFLVIGAFCVLILATFILDIMTGPSLLDATKVLHSLFEFIGLHTKSSRLHKLL